MLFSNPRIRMRNVYFCLIVLLSVNLTQARPSGKNLNIHHASEKECPGLRNKLGRLNDQIGEYEGEIATLRGRIGGLEDEVSKLRGSNKWLQDDIARLRTDLDEETNKRIQAENKALDIEEEHTFQMNVAEAEINKLKALIDRDRGMEIRDRERERERCPKPSATTRSTRLQGYLP